MKLQSFGIANFKAFGQDIQRMPLKPITLIFGPNSAGKSSLIHSLLWVSESALQKNYDIRTSQKVSGNLDLGGFRSIVRNHDLNEKVVVTFETDSLHKDDAIEIRATIGMRQYIDDLCYYRKALMQDPVAFEFHQANLRHLECVEKLNKDFHMIHFREMEGNNSIFFGRYLVNEEAWNAIISEEIQARREAEWKDDRCDRGEFLTWVEAQDAYEKAMDSWETCRMLAAEAVPKIQDIHREFERKRAEDRKECSVLSFDVRFRGKLVLSASRELASDQIKIDLDSIDEDFWQEFMKNSDCYSPNTLIDGSRILGHLRILLDEDACPHADFCNLIVNGVIPWLQNQQETFLMFANGLIVIGPLRALPARRELLGFPGESMHDPLLIPWKRLRDLDSLRETVNKSLQLLTNSTLRFKRLAFGRIGRVARIEYENQFPVERSYLSCNLEEVEYKSTNWMEKDFMKGFNRFQLEFHTPEKQYYSEVKDYDDDSADLMVEDFIKNHYPDELLVDLCLQNGDSEMFVSMQDVGVGISQIAPVLVQAHGNKKKTIAIEQPEIHIHPRLQAKLADVFIESALGENQNTFLLETHSEHLILRILRRIRETTRGKTDSWPEQLRVACPNGIKPEDVAVLYVEPGEDGAKVRELRIDEHGRFIDEWPNGFFEERFNEEF